MIKSPKMKGVATNVIFAQMGQDETRIIQASDGSGSKQMLAKEGIKRVGERAVLVIFKEYKQFMDQE